MLMSNRFTTIPTKKTRERLENALSNAQPIARGEADRSAVMAIQAALADLNRGYLLGGEIDGFYNDRTFQAVEAFQRDYGLFADGMVAKQTMMQLDMVYTSDVLRKPFGVSVHVGVDFLDKAHYGDENRLASCVNDARAMRDLAEKLGYNTLVLENENATVSNFTGFMRNAIDNLFAGDSLLVTFSGHGSQMVNTSSDEETDLYDETLCFYDRMLIDDEFYALLAQLREGVRVHAVFDSCHSATVAKQVNLSIEQERAARKEEKEKEVKKNLLEAVPFKEMAERFKAAGKEIIKGKEFSLDDLLPISGKSIEKALAGEKPELASPPVMKKELNQEITSLFADLYANGTTGNSKSIQLFEPIYEKNKELYDAIKNVVGDKENLQVSCSVVTISACQDSQTTPAGSVNSLFTYNMLNAWRSGQFDGSYNQFHTIIRNASRADATPVLNTYGANRVYGLLYERPFVF